MASLRAQAGPLAGRTIPLTGPCTLGRSPDNSLPLEDDAVSRHHARLSPGPEGWVIEDLGSRNGTLVDGRACQKLVLRGGEKIQVGQSLFAFEAEAASGRPPPPAPAAARSRRLPWLIYGAAALLLLFALARWRSRAPAPRSLPPPAEESAGPAAAGGSAGGGEVSFKARREARRAYSKGLFQLQIGDRKAALQNFRQSLQLNPEYEAARLKLAETTDGLRAEIEGHLLQGDRELRRLQVEFAVRQYRRALSLAGDFDPALAAKARQKIAEAQAKKRELEGGDADT